VCRNIKQLRGIEPEALEEASNAAALQYVRKVSGFAHPSRANEEAFDRATAEIAAVTRRLLAELVVRTSSGGGGRRV
jgi:hypothetical protein